MVDLSYLDKEQKEAVLSENKNSIVIAAPGSGKTTTIINKVNYLVDKGISKDNIIIITFTKAAAVNMRDRYEKKFKRNNSPFFGTFHSLFYRILKRANYEFSIIPSYEGNEVVKNELLNIYDDVTDDRVRELLNAISLFKTSNENIEEFQVEGVNKEAFIKCYESYELFKREKSYYDFDDLQIEALKLFKINNRLLKSYSSLFKYILVDEFQDCDLMQIELLKLFSINGSNIFAVGDEDQCIYGFRGSKPQCMVDFHKIFNKGEKMYLNNNYRSPKNIVESSINLIQNNKLRNSKEIRAFKDSFGEIQSSLFESEREEANFIGDVIIKKVTSAECTYDNNAILYRTNEESRSIIDVFINKNIPFSLIDKEYNFYDNFICRDIINYFRVSLDVRDKESLVKIINKPFRYVGKNLLFKLRNHPYKENCFDILTNHNDIKPFQINNLKDLEKDIVNLNKMSLQGAINSIMFDLDYYKYLEEYGKTHKIPMEQLEETIDLFKESAMDFRNIVSFLSHVEQVKQEIEENKKKLAENKGVLLSTIHGVKGMEFPNVFIINCNEDIIPHSNSSESEINIEEERRLFYVGITRAMENLWINFVKSKAGKDRKPSRFITELKLEREGCGSFNFRIDDKVKHKVFGLGTITDIKNNIITINFDDKMERRLDLAITYSNGLLERIE